MNRTTRFYLALHATQALALAAAMGLHLAPIPAHWAPLAQRPVWTVWALVCLWLFLSAAAVALQPLTLWRAALRAAGALLLALGLAGLALGTSLAGSMLAGLCACALGCLGLGAAIAPARIQAPRHPGNAQRSAAPAAGLALASLWQRVAGWPHWPFAVVAALAIESFRLAHIVGTGQARPSGMAGLLTAFFLALPAATLRHWWAGWAAALWLLAAAAYAGLACKAGLPQWSMAAALCLWQPGWALLQRFRKAPPAAVLQPHHEAQNKDG